ncbi:MAG: YbaB/EbfC family nucleoid-associated protein [Chloroflexi bacterium]|nr:YbaB/EbfC family nucleoid-associated protein [Chloroflexota bacterium]
MLQQVQQIQRQMQKIQEALGSETVEGSAGGAVTITITGHLKVTNVQVDPEAVDPQDVSLLEEMLVTAINDAISKAQDLAAKRLEPLTGGLKGLGLPPGLL